MVIMTTLNEALDMMMARLFFRRLILNR